MRRSILDLGMAAKMSSWSPSTFSIGNCRVEVEGDNVTCKSSNSNDLQISVSSNAKIKLSVDSATRRIYNTRKNTRDLLCSKPDNQIVLAETCSSQRGHSFDLVNPKDTDIRTKSLLQGILRMYRKELPAMNYAANTGKESLFLQRCISNGKYCTLILILDDIEESGEVIAAVTYQIIPVDTQYAEIPLAAVSSKYQHKGIGCLLYSELRKRLLDVGTRTIFCWGDKESEEFWVKQGFIQIAKIGTGGRARRLPIKADIQRALCFPGGSTLMVSHLNKDSDSLSNPSNHLKAWISLKAHTNSSSLPLQSHEPWGGGESCDISNSIPKKGVVLNGITSQTKAADTQLLIEDGCVSDDVKDTGYSPGRDLAQDCRELSPLNAVACDNITNTLGEDREHADRNHYACSRKCLKRRIWEASCSSIKSKKVKGGHHIGCHPGSSSEWRLQSKDDQGSNYCLNAFSLGTSKGKSYMEIIPKDVLKNTCSALHIGESETVHINANEDQIPGALPPRGEYRIMLMNIADDVKKTFLSKIIEELGGSVTSEGSVSTHVVTGKARRTLNFCTALCSGAWIVSTNWLKESYRKSRFVDELAFILEDQDYALTYKSELKDTVLRAKACPQALLKGYDFFLAKHVQPPDAILSAIIRSAGGNVVRRMDKVSEASRTIFIACEEDMEEAITAAQRGAWTYCSDWLMNCVMKQELDLQAPQFAESL